LIPDTLSSPGYHRTNNLARIPGSEQGFTLWEVLVVVIIVTISVSAILLSTSFSSGSGNLKLLGNDLGKTMRLLYQEAIFENKNYAISLNQQGFTVLEYDGENWAASKQGFYRKPKLNESQRSQLLIEDLVVKLANANDAVPHILILSSGEMTAFEWNIIDSNARASVTISGDILGNILVSEPVPQS
jgi:general secretion pathway protein H